MCLKYINVNTYAQQQVNDWLLTSSRYEPGIHELAIMVADVPRRQQKDVIHEILRLIQIQTSHPISDVAIKSAVVYIRAGDQQTYRKSQKRVPLAKRHHDQDAPSTQ